MSFGNCECSGAKDQLIALKIGKNKQIDYILLHVLSPSDVVTNSQWLKCKK